MTSTRSIGVCRDGPGSCRGEPIVPFRPRCFRERDVFGLSVCIYLTRCLHLSHTVSHLFVSVDIASRYRLRRVTAHDTRDWSNVDNICTNTIKLPVRKENRKEKRNNKRTSLTKGKQDRPPLHTARILFISETKQQQPRRHDKQPEGKKIRKSENQPKKKQTRKSNRICSGPV